MNSKNAQTNFILFAVAARQRKNKNTFRKDICQPLDGGFLWGKSEGMGPGRGTDGTTTSSAIFYFLKKKK